MTINTDFEIQADKDIRYIGAAHGVSGAGYYTVIEFHRWLSDLADDASSAGDDNLDITKDTPSDRSTDNIITLLNGYNIDQTASEHLYNGSIIQAGGAEIFDGILVYANPGMDLQIHQNGSIIASDFWNNIPFGTGLKGLNPDAANGISHRFLLKVRTAGADIDGRRLITQTRVWGKTFSEFAINGTSRGNNVSALTYADDLNNQTASGTVAGWTTISNTEGYRSIDVDNNATPENYYSEWNKSTYTINQFYERMKYISRQESAETLYGLPGEQFRGITHEVQLTTPRSGTFNAQEEVCWGVALTGVVIAGTAGQFTCTAGTIAVGQRLRISGTFGGTGSITGYSDPTFYRVSATNGTTSFTLISEAGAALTTTAGTPTGLTYNLLAGSGRMLAINSTTTGTKMWIQLLTGVAPSASLLITGSTSGATSSNSGTPTEYAVPGKGSLPFIGTSTGSTLIGAYGVGLEAADLSANDKVFDLTNTQRQAPNYVTFTVSNLVSGDRVLVAPLGYRFEYDTEAAGPFTVGETLTFTSPAGTAVLAKLTDNGTTGEMWISTMVTGTIPTDNSGITGGTSGATANVNGTVNNDINLRQMNLNGALTGAAVTSVVVNGSIPSDTPSSGTIRILRANGFYTRHAYSAWSGSTFTISSTDFSSNNAANSTNLFVSYFDDAADATSESFTGIYSADRSLYVRVRNGGGTPKIKTYESSATLGSAGGSATVSRISDE